LDAIEYDMRTAGVCMDDVGVVLSGGLGQRWPTSNG